MLYLPQRGLLYSILCYYQSACASKNGGFAYVGINADCSRKVSERQQSNNIWCRLRILEDNTVVNNVSRAVAKNRVLKNMVIFQLCACAQVARDHIWVTCKLPGKLR